MKTEGNTDILKMKNDLYIYWKRGWLKKIISWNETIYIVVKQFYRDIYRYWLIGGKNEKVTNEEEKDFVEERRSLNTYSKESWVWYMKRW